MTIKELHTEWLRLGERACVKVTPTAYKELRDWEAAQAEQWDELIAYDLAQKKAAAEDIEEVKYNYNSPIRKEIS